MARKRKRRPAPVLEEGVLHLFTDGSCHPNPGPGGWGVVMLYNGHRKELYGGGPRETNNSMELTAIAEALKARTRPVPTRVYADSKYAIDCITVWHRAWRRRGWKTGTGTPVKNRGLIEEVTALLGPEVKVLWVKGHAGHEHNERADALARQGRLEYGGTPPHRQQKRRA